MSSHRDDPTAPVAAFVPGTLADAALGPPLAEILGLAAQATAPATETTPRRFGLVVGSLAGLDDAGRPLVQFPDSPGEGPLAARSLVPLGREAIGREAALLFDGGDPLRPVVIGLLRPIDAAPAPPDARPTPLPVASDGDRLTLSADREIVLRCGEASITLTRAGKILLRGAYLLSRSSGVNRIKGGSVQIN